MKFLPNVLRVIILAPPDGFEPKLESKTGPELGTKNTDGHFIFETPYVCKQDVEGPAIRREAERRWSIYIGWYDAAGKRRGRVLVPLDRVPHLAWDSEITVQGSYGDEPARGIAEVVGARNIDDYLPEIEP